MATCTSQHQSNNTSAPIPEVGAVTDLAAGNSPTELLPLGDMAHDDTVYFTWSILNSADEDIAVITCGGPDPVARPGNHEDDSSLKTHTS
ncbi:MAG: hypothetical protein AUG75_00955 [Cyanobacteria bacterium 13_1_20CM_4_61_6]|nr:MAG: hypothetical protein AUG75_00955 [Cyanobacteria bacterium 13_1_20CM_4_61_6]